MGEGCWREAGGAGLLGHAHVGARVRGPEVREGPGVGVAAVGRARRAGSGVRENPNPRATKAQLLPSARPECQTGSSTTTAPLGGCGGPERGGWNLKTRRRPSPSEAYLRDGRAAPPDSEYLLSPGSPFFGGGSPKSSNPTRGTTAKRGPLPRPWGGRYVRADPRAPRPPRAGGGAKFRAIWLCPLPFKSST